MKKNLYGFDWQRNLCHTNTPWQQRSINSLRKTVGMHENYWAPNIICLFREKTHFIIGTIAEYSPINRSHNEWHYNASKWHNMCTSLLRSREPTWEDPNCPLSILVEIFYIGISSKQSLKLNRSIKYCRKSQLINLNNAKRCEYM